MMESRHLYDSRDWSPGEWFKIIAKAEYMQAIPLDEKMTRYNLIPLPEYYLQLQSNGSWRKKIKSLLDVLKKCGENYNLLEFSDDPLHLQAVLLKKRGLGNNRYVQTSLYDFPR